MVVLVTGAEGFVGRHLVDYLSAVGGVRGVGLVAEAMPEGVPGWRHVRVDLSDRERVEAIVADVRPDVVFHLADPMMRVRLSGSDADSYLAAQRCWLNLLNAARTESPGAKVLLASSSAVYGRVEASQLPIRETVPARPLSLQGVAKAAQELAAHVFGACYGIHVVVLRTFNLLGPGLSPAFVSSALAKQVVEIATGRREPVIEVGNLSPVRDYVDIADAVEAYWMLAGRGEAGEAYNVCASRAYSVQKVLDRLLSRHPAAAPVEVRQSERLQRACDIPVSHGSHAKLRAATGWAPRRSLDESLASMCEYWESVIRASDKESTA